MKETLPDHMKFLRTYKEVKVGDRLPHVSATERTAGPSLPDCIQGHLLLIVVSVQCEICYDALRELYAFLDERPHANAVILLDGDEPAWETLSEQFAGRARVFQKSKEALLQELGTRGVPWGYGISGDGYVRVSLPCSRPEDFEQLTLVLE